MKKTIRMALVCSMLFVAVVAPAADDKLGDTPYYPLRVGTTWIYKVGDGKVTIRVAKHEKVGDVLCALVEASRDGKVIGSEHLAVNSAGVVRHTLTNKQGEKPVVMTLKPAMLVLKLPPKKGDTWKVDSTADGKTFRGAFKIDEEEVKVPAGSYKTVRVTSQDLEVDGLKPTITTYYASGVGMVKQVIQESDGKVEIELEKFETPK